MLYPVVLAVAIANTINAGVDIGAIAAAINLVVPLPIRMLIVPIAGAILIIQVWGSYRLLANVFKWLTLSLFAYVASAFYARPDWGSVLRGTFVPTVRMDRQFLMIFVGLLGTTITPYLFFWQANQEVEEEIAMGRRTLRQRAGATPHRTGIRTLGCRHWDVVVQCRDVLHHHGDSCDDLEDAGGASIDSAIQAASALRPLAGSTNSLL